MSSPFSECVDHLQSALGAQVHLPATDGYRTALGKVFFPDAARRHPACVVQPRAVGDVSTVMRIAEQTGCRVTVRGGGLSWCLRPETSSASPTPALARRPICGGRCGAARRSFGAVTSAVLRSHEMGPVWVDRMVLGPGALATYFRIAPEFPRDTTMGAVLGYSDLAPSEPVLFVYTACASGANLEAWGLEFHDLVYTACASGANPRFRRCGRIGHADPGGTHAGVPDRFPTHRWRAGGRGRRRDGVLGRTGEWNIPLNAIWSGDADGTACTAWARATLSALASHTIGNGSSLAGAIRH